MKIDKIKLYVLEILLVLVLVFLALFESNIISKLSVAIMLTGFALLITSLIKKRNSISTASNYVFLLMIGFAVIYLAIFYFSGMHFGFYKATVKFGLWGIFTYIIPLTVIIIASEKIRQVLLAQKGKLNSILVFVSMVLVDIIVYTQVYDIRQFSDFLAIVGFVTFASIACNLLYNYISVRYGAKPVIVYRLITVLYAYVIPVIPDVYIFIRSMFRMVYPYFIFLIIDRTLVTQNKGNSLKDKQMRIVGNAVLLIIATIIAYLVSCQFTFGMLVVGSGSMTGTIDKGDAAVYKELGDEEIKENDVIVFKRDNLTIIHRVVDVKAVNGQYRYFTKGDANLTEDDGYVTRSDIVGKTKFRLRFVGYPTLLIRDLFNKK